MSRRRLDLPLTVHQRAADQRPADGATKLVLHEGAQRPPSRQTVAPERPSAVQGCFRLWRHDGRHLAAANQQIGVSCLSFIHDDSAVDT